MGLVARFLACLAMVKTERPCCAANMRPFSSEIDIYATIDRSMRIAASCRRAVRGGAAEHPKGAREAA